MSFHVAHKGIISTLCLFSLLTLSACGEKPASAASANLAMATPIKVVNIKTTSLRSKLNALGTLSARKSIVLTTTVTEKLTGLYFDDGQFVEKGSLLATLAQAEERALLAAAKADLAEHEREIARLKPLLERQIAARTEYDQRISNRDRALALIAEAEAKIDERTLVAPFSGYVGLRAVSVGALLSSGEAITSLDDLDTLQLDFQVPSRALANLSVGQEVQAFSDALQKRFVGQVTAMEQRIDPVSRSITARALLENKGGPLKPGMLMRVEILEAAREGIEIPEEALLSSQDEHYVWLVDSAQQALRRTVTIGERRPGMVEIRSGLEPGEQLIVEGYMSLRPGSLVTIKEG